MNYASKDDRLAVEGTAALYLVRVPTKRDKLALAHDVRALGGRVHTEAALAARVTAFIASAFAAEPDERERLLAMVRRYGEERQRMTELAGAAERELVALVRAAREGKPPPAGLPPPLMAIADEIAAFLPVADEYGRIERLVEERDPLLRELRADNEVYFAIHNYCAARLLLAGYEARPRMAELTAKAHPRQEPERALPALPPFRLVAGRVADEVMEAIPDEDIGRIGDRVWRAMGPTEAEAKNSVSPPGTAPGGGSSTSASTGRPSVPAGSSPAIPDPMATAPTTGPAAG
jgi:hypothetical protein